MKSQLEEENARLLVENEKLKESRKRTEDELASARNLLHHIRTQRDDYNNENFKLTKRSELLRQRWVTQDEEKRSTEALLAAARDHASKTVGGWAAMVRGRAQIRAAYDPMFKLIDDFIIDFIAEHGKAPDRKEAMAFVDEWYDTALQAADPQRADKPRDAVDKQHEQLTKIVCELWYDQAPKGRDPPGISSWVVLVKSAVEPQE